MLLSRFLPSLLRARSDVASCNFGVGSPVVVTSIYLVSVAPSVLVIVALEGTELLGGSSLGSSLFSCSLLRAVIRENVALIRFSPDELTGLLLLPDLANLEAALESLWAVVSSTGVAGVDAISGRGILAVVLATVLPVYARLPRRSSGKLILRLGVSTSTESL